MFQAKRYIELQRRTGRNHDSLDCSYHAALYLLSGDAGITRAQEEAMLAGSLFGWDTPAAKPWHYNRDGTPRHFPPAKNEPER